VFWTLLASGQINMRKVGWRSPQNPLISRLTLPPETIPSCTRERATPNSNGIPDGTRRRMLGFWSAIRLGKL
jgi:hypothetical protein